MSEISKLLVVIGIFLILAGLGLPYLSKLGFFGKLPGDFSYKSGNFSFYFPVITCLVVSVLLTIILNLIFHK